jgi:hypothetical protein
VRVIKIKRTVRRPTAPARPSRIRRDPALADNAQHLRRDAWWMSSEWEVRFAIIGITFFAVAISAVVIDIGILLAR